MLNVVFVGRDTITLKQHEGFAHAILFSDRREVAFGITRSLEDQIEP